MNWPPSDADLVKHCSDVYNDAAAVQLGHVQYAIEQDDFSLVTIRGSDEARDWLQNLSCRPLNYKGFSVHSGYFHAAASLVAAEERLLARPRLCLCGHSAGGCIALLTAIILLQEYNWKGDLQVFMIGSPWCIDRDTDFINLTVRRITHVQDPIMLTSPTLALCFRPVGSLDCLWRPSCPHASHSIHNYKDILTEADKA